VTLELVRLRVQPLSPTGPLASPKHPSTLNPRTEKREAATDT
jgi:hypothetical protein